MKSLIFTILVLNSIQSKSIEFVEQTGETIFAQGGTGFRINEVRTFEADGNTVFLKDGQIIPVVSAQGGTGYKVRYSINATNQNLTEGTFVEVDLINIYKGTLLAKNPFVVSGVDGFVNSQTFYPNGSGLNELNIGDSIVVSGFVDNNSSAVITRVEKVSTLSEWKISGYVKNLSSNEFLVNNLVVQFQPSDLGGCNSSLQNGDFIEIFADPVSGFEMGDVLDTVTEINCVDRSVNPGGVTTVIIEGMIDSVDNQGDFILSGQQIDVGQTTKFIRGKMTDIQERIKIEVEGEVDSLTGVVMADKIRFVGDRINITLPVEVGEFNLPDINVGGASFFVTPQVTDPDMVVMNGLSETTQLQLKGYDSGEGDLYVTRINVRGSVDYNDISLDGVVTSINAPFIEVFGVNIDTTTSSFIDENGMPISAIEFFGLISAGDKVLLDGAELDSLTNQISGGHINIEEFAEPDDSNLEGPIVPTVYGVGTITGLSDPIFSSTFE